MWLIYYLQGSKDSVGTRFLEFLLLAHCISSGFWGLSHLDSTLFGLNISIFDLAMVNDNGIATGATGSIVGPTNALRELGFGVGQEQLCINGE